MFKYGCMLLCRDGVSVDKEEAARYFKMAVDKGETDSMNNYGMMLQSGEGIEKNASEVKLECTNMVKCLKMVKEHYKMKN